jgi:hypothetical protein
LLSNYEAGKPTFSIIRASRRRHRAQYQNRRRITIASIFIVIIAIIVGLSYSGIFTSVSQMSSHDKMLLHIHPHLEILIFGNPITIPANIGISSNIWKNHTIDTYGMTGMAPLHTHDTSGTIHVESNTVRNYTLGQFFDVWGVQFNESCILDKCSGSSGKIGMTINGVTNNEYRSHVLKDGELIRIVFG